MDGSIKIGDFGLVTAVEENCADDVSVDLTPATDDRLLTDQVGTKLYMSPEQVLLTPLILFHSTSQLFVFLQFLK